MRPVPPGHPATSLYIHVPFCASRCSYCDFYSTTFAEEGKEAYARALTKELLARKDEAGTLQTIYWGGGTPSQLGEAHIERIFDMLRQAFRIAPGAEVTFECNPDDVTPGLAALLRRVGVNRVSLGVQTFDDNLLRRIRRRHSARTAREAVGLLAERTTDDLSIDLIYGLPGQSLERFRADVREALALPVCHISAYALAIEPGTHFHALLRRGDIRETDEETSRRMYECLMDETRDAGFEHYEISNFARPGRRSRHNMAYWSGDAYLGAGPAAHSYDGAFRRRENAPDLAAYCRQAPHVPFRIETLTASQRYDETVMTRLRTADGLDLQGLAPAEQAYLLREARSHLQAGNLLLDGDVLRLSRNGIFVSDGIMADLMKAE